MEKKHIIYIVVAIGAIAGLYFLFGKKIIAKSKGGNPTAENATKETPPPYQTDGWEGDTLRWEGNKWTVENNKWVLIGKE